MEVGLKSAWRSGTATVGTGVMLEAFHSVGTVDVVTDWLNKLVSGLQNTAAPSFKKIWQGKPAIIMSKNVLQLTVSMHNRIMTQMTIGKIVHSCKKNLYI